MRSLGSAVRALGTRVLCVMTVVIPLSGLLSSFTLSAEPRKPSLPQLETRPPPPELMAWRATIVRIPRPKPGCFKATYPSTEWQEVPCVPGPNRPYAPARGPRPTTVGNGNDFAAEVQQGTTISSARGSFDDARGAMAVPSYSLQLNTNRFATSLCDNAANPATCKGWQQFVYSFLEKKAFIQYWLIDYGPQCPAGWNPTGSDCYKNDAAVPVPPQINPRFVELQGTAGSGGGLDSIVVATLSSALSNTATPVFDLAAGWQIAEFNIFGDGNGSQVNFASGSNMIVRTHVDNGTGTPPLCATDTGFTSETNNFTLVPPCCRYGGPAPAIVFDQSTNVGATAYCANGTSVGDTHLTNFNGLLYDFQAAGDFLLAEIDPDFVVQTRQKSGAPTWPNASINNAVAMKMGKTRLAICLEPNRFIVDGKLNDLGDGKALSLPGVTVTRNGNVYVFTHALKSLYRV
jgi:hypothetical protein